MRERLRYSLDVGQRIVAAFVGGYALTILVSILIADALPGPMFDRVMTAVMLSFLILPGIVLWAFALPSSWSIWTRMLPAGLLLGGLVYLIHFSGAA
jgi:hypothetical protein